MLDLSVNELDGQIPYFASSTLINLNLSGNHLTGSIPLEGMHTTELQVRLSYPQMESLDLSSNSLTGILPPEISNLGRLKLLNLGENQLSGELPSELSKLHGLEYLDFSNNDFKGQIPENLSLNLSVFNVSYNDLSGTVPENLRRFPYSSFHPGNSFLLRFYKDNRASSDGVNPIFNGEGKREHGSQKISGPFVSGTAYCLSSCAMILMNKVVLSSYSFSAGISLMFYQFPETPFLDEQLNSVHKRNSIGS
nr:probable inactive receptor kinase At5g10020 [Ipomoea batatas]